MQNKVIITGGSGFIGSHLCEAMLSLGNYVTCVDNLSTSSIHNISHLMHHPSFEFIRHDVTIPLELYADLVFNLAAPASPNDYQRDPISTTRTIINGALNILSMAVSQNSRVLQASTSEVYGDPSVHPQQEDYWGNVNPIGPRSCYDEGKRCAESLFFDFKRQHNLVIKIARIFNTYGPRMRPDDGRVVSTFIDKALRGEPLGVYGDGTQTRSFCYIQDLIAGLIALMQSEPTFTGPLNIGNPAEIKVIDLAELIISITGSKSDIVFLPLPVDDPRRRQPCIQKAKEQIRWEPTTDLISGLLKTISWSENRLLDNTTRL